MRTAADRLPLSGIRVLDFTRAMAGPYCTRLLSDLGAEVWKVEPPKGDGFRSCAPVVDGRSRVFGQLNQGKKSIVLNLKSVDQREIAVRLAGIVDIVVENFRPGTTHRLGLDYAVLKDSNPALIYCSISGYGKTSTKAAYAPSAHAASGYDDAQRRYQGSEEGPPATGIMIADVLAGLSAFGAIQTALVNRLRSGVGTSVDASLFEAMLNLMPYEFQAAQLQRPQPRVVYTSVRAVDGYLSVTPLEEHHFVALANRIGRPNLVDDPRFLTSEARFSNWAELMTITEEWTRQRSARECENILAADGIPCSMTRSMREALGDPTVVREEMLVPLTDGTQNYLRPRPPFQLGAMALCPTLEVPELGQHSKEILAALIVAEEALSGKPQRQAGG